MAKGSTDGAVDVCDEAGGAGALGGAVAFDAAEDEDDSPSGYANRLVVSGGSGTSESSRLILGVSGGGARLLDSLGLLKKFPDPDPDPKMLLPEPKEGVGLPNKDVPGVAVAELDMELMNLFVGVDWGVVDSALS